jgi:molecular chaperone GrpE
MSDEFDSELADLLAQEASSAEEKSQSAEEVSTTSEADSASTEAEDASRADAGSREAELLADLQRLQAEFVNYKARVERDRDVARNNAIAEAIRAFLPALDDLARAEAHGDLEGSPFAAVVTKLRNAGDKFGLKQFGAKGEKFDPELHNALVQTPNPDVTENVIADVVEPGFMLGDRLLRPAMVAVFIPAE